MSSIRYILTAVIVSVAAIGCHGYGYGVPETACDELFPMGHFRDARDTPAPFEILVNATTYEPNDVIEVQLDTKTDSLQPDGRAWFYEVQLNAKTDTMQPDGRAWFYEGVIVQARTFSCSPTQQKARGTFAVQSGEDFLQPIKCHEVANSAIRHFNHAHIYNRTFYWTAPATAVGHLAIRATVARNHDLFWVDVYSDVIADSSSSRPTSSLSPCPARRIHNAYEFCPVQPTTEEPTDGAVTTTSGAVSFILAVATALLLR